MSHRFIENYKIMQTPTFWLNKGQYLTDAEAAALLRVTIDQLLDLRDMSEELGLDSLGLTVRG